MHISLYENQEILLRDLKSINEDMSIDSHSGLLVIDVLLYLLTHEFKCTRIMIGLIPFL